jgi:Fic family protein
MDAQRAGHYVKQPTGYRAFVPKPLPPQPPLRYDNELIGLLAKAAQSLGRLDGVARTLPNPDLFVSMYVTKEALLSSQIEGTQASFVAVLETENAPQDDDVLDVSNYVRALDFGLTRLRDLPFSLRLLREIHAHLLASGRGSEKGPGEFRRSQNWIGPKNSTLNNAAFVPPAVDDMNDALGEFERFYHAESDIPFLVKVALMHAQFETIHPFLDGNGRMGRLLITFMLCVEGVLERPLLYLSHYFKMNRGEYYSRLMDLRLKGDWEGWVRFFLKGVQVVADESVTSAGRILTLHEQSLALIRESGSSVNLSRALELLFRHPIVFASTLVRELAISPPTARSLLQEFCRIGLLIDNAPHKSRNKSYRFIAYLEILEPGTEL